MKIPTNPQRSTSSQPTAALARQLEERAEAHNNRLAFLEEFCMIVGEIIAGGGPAKKPELLVKVLSRLEILRGPPEEDDNDGLST